VDPGQRAFPGKLINSKGSPFSPSSIKDMTMPMN
jgi:hypothetical protein